MATSTINQQNLLIKTKSITKSSATSSGTWYNTKYYSYDISESGYNVVSVCPYTSTESGTYWYVRDFSDTIATIVSNDELNNSFNGSLRIVYEKK